MSKYKRYREKWDKAAKGIVKLGYPLHLNFELTFGCNYQCDACLHGLPASDWRYQLDPKSKISLEKFKEIIDEGVNNGLCSIELNGINEPLMKRDISDYIKYASENGLLEISLHTNGSLLDEEMSKSLSDSGLTLIIFSIDAFHEETYKCIRQDDNYHEVIDNINKFLEFNENIKTRVSFVESKVNHEEYDLFKDYWAGKVDVVTKVGFCNCFEGTEYYGKIKEKYSLRSFEAEKCVEPFTRLFISNNGNTFPCCSFFGGEVLVGNIYDSSIYEIWNGSRIKDLRKMLSEDINLYRGACKRCVNSKTF